MFSIALNNIDKLIKYFILYLIFPEKNNKRIEYILLNLRKKSVKAIQLKEKIEAKELKLILCCFN